MNKKIKYLTLSLAALIFCFSLANAQKRGSATAQVTATVVISVPADYSVSPAVNSDQTNIQTATLHVTSSDVVAVDIQDGKRGETSSIVLQNGESQNINLCSTSENSVVRFSYLTY
jgi:hypothetical protein